MSRLAGRQIGAQGLVSVERTIADAIDSPNQHAGDLDALHLKGDLLGGKGGFEDAGWELGDLVVGTLEAGKTNASLLEHTVAHDENPFVGLALDEEALNKFACLLDSDDDDRQDNTTHDDGVEDQINPIDVAPINRREINLWHRETRQKARSSCNRVSCTFSDLFRHLLIIN